jgi:hypothetical protein
MNKPNEHFAMFYGNRKDGWQQFAIMGPADAAQAVLRARGKVIAQDMVTGEQITYG